jgi:hypothetical protein
MKDMELKDRPLNGNKIKFKLKTVYYNQHWCEAQLKISRNDS